MLIGSLGGGHPVEVIGVGSIVSLGMTFRTTQHMNDAC